MYVWRHAEAERKCSEYIEFQKCTNQACVAKCKSNHGSSFRHAACVHEEVGAQLSCEFFVGFFAFEPKNRFFFSSEFLSTPLGLFRPIIFSWFWAPSSRCELFLRKARLKPYNMITDPPTPKLHLVVALLTVATLLLFSSAVRSEPQVSRSAIRLPSEKSNGGGGLCSGAAARPGSCPVKCFRADPVCGVDGETYRCGCADAVCSGVEVTKLGYCEVGSGGPGPLPGQALLLVHIVWLIVLGFSVLFGLF
ncbi:uncharacterized protein LOC115747566 [Rhodamnia argentea]|uniref:Uncharacterized protein LOC115747566 n=1 Tax=Rhodamnia argentea TaxID=178133 RepID=A0A8B8PZC5_9MYRT|nr:uncharacterized protein LOC115747566 [Rhodamnia argentea]